MVYCWQETQSRKESNWQPQTHTYNHHQVLHHLRRLEFTCLTIKKLPSSTSPWPAPKHQSHPTASYTLHMHYSYSLSTHWCLKPGRRFEAAVWLCACTSEEREHAATEAANREKAQTRPRPPARARSLPGNCGCSGTRSTPRPCGRPHLCAVRSHNQKLGRQEDDTHTHTHTGKNSSVDQLWIQTVAERKTKNVLKNWQTSEMRSQCGGHTNAHILG